MTSLLILRSKKMLDIHIEYKCNCTGSILINGSVKVDFLGIFEDEMIPDIKNANFALEAIDAFDKGSSFLTLFEIINIEEFKNLLNKFSSNNYYESDEYRTFKHLLQQHIIENSYKISQNLTKHYNKIFENISKNSQKIKNQFIKWLINFHINSDYLLWDINDDCPNYIIKEKLKLFENEHINDIDNSCKEQCLIKLLYHTGLNEEAALLSDDCENIEAIMNKYMPMLDIDELLKTIDKKALYIDIDSPDEIGFEISSSARHGTLISSAVGCIDKKCNLEVWDNL